MYPLVESVRIENRQLHHVELHNQRINLARQVIYKQYQPIDINSLVKIPEWITNDRYKCRITFYPEKSEYSITPYHQREINTLKIITDDTIDYSFKNENRFQLDAAYSRRENCDDIIIIKKGHLTDAWAANIILFDGKNWITPDTPLLRGVQREFLLQEVVIIEKEVKLDHLPSFQTIKLINAMIDFERAPVINVSNDVFY
jgi:4-amino-4-deoxychorismate lyase